MPYKPSYKSGIDPVNPPCRKQIFDSREAAEDMIRYITDIRITPVIRAYRCDVCGFWHLTKKT